MTFFLKSLPVLALAAASALGLTADDAFAQERGSGPKASATCMVRTLENGGVFPIVLPKTDVAAMEAKGFEEEPCRKAFGSRAKVEEWRDFICKIASIDNEKRQEKFEEQWGERPGVLCGMAEMSSSRWERRRAAR